MAKTKCLVIKKDSFINDPKLLEGSRGDRKILVTEFYNDESPCDTDIWNPTNGNPNPVQKMADTEVAVFNQIANQDRHYHEQATEMYMLLEGKMRIEVEGKIFNLLAGDMIVVNPGSYHKVLTDPEIKFLCRVVTVNCKGEADKYI